MERGEWMAPNTCAELRGLRAVPSKWEVVSSTFRGEDIEAP